jgi:hypothetical protein
MQVVRREGEVSRIAIRHITHIMHSMCTTHCMHNMHFPVFLNKASHSIIREVQWFDCIWYIMQLFLRTFVCPKTMHKHFSKNFQGLYSMELVISERRSLHITYNLNLLSNFYISRQTTATNSTQLSPWYADSALTCALKKLPFYLKA